MKKPITNDRERIEAAILDLALAVEEGRWSGLYQDIAAVLLTDEKEQPEEGRYVGCCKKCRSEMGCKDVMCSCHVTLCQHPQERNVLTDITPEKLAKLREEGAVITEIPQEKTATEIGIESREKEYYENLKKQFVSRSSLLKILEEARSLPPSTRNKVIDYIKHKLESI